MPRWTPTFLTELRRTARWHRKVLAAGLAAAAVTIGIEAASAPDPPTTSMTVAAGSLSGGATLRQQDLTTVEVPPDVVPESAVTVEDAVGAVLAAPIGPGEPLSSTRLLGASLLEGWGPDLVASPVRIADAGSVGVLTVGDREGGGEAVAPGPTRGVGGRAGGGGSPRGQDGGHHEGSTRRIVVGGVVISASLTFSPG